MTKRPYLHVLLIAALCFSQIAANVHMAGHLQTSTDAGFTSFSPNLAKPHPHPDHHSERHHLERYHSERYHKERYHKEHYHSRPAEAWAELAWTAIEHTQRYHQTAAVSVATASHNDHDNSSDCAIYHAYVGQSVCLFALTGGFSIALSGIGAIPIEASAVFTQNPHRHPIRGPPSFS